MQYIESSLQQACKRWFNLQYPHYARLFYAVPNGGSRNYKEAVKMKREGIVAGVSDMVLQIPNSHFHGMNVEFKTKTGRQSPHQKEFEKAVTEMGYRYVIVRDVSEFVRIVKEYLAD